MSNSKQKTCGLMKTSDIAAHDQHLNPQVIRSPQKCILLFDWVCLCDPVTEGSGKWENNADTVS